MNLTEREYQIMEMLINGMSLKEISFSMNITYKTVDFHRNNLYQKLNINSIHELLAQNLAGKLPSKKISAENPMTVNLQDEGPHGWEFKYNSIPLFYENKIEAGDIFNMECTFTSDVNLSMLMVTLADNTVIKDGYWTALSNFSLLKRSIKPNIEYNSKVTITAITSASSTKPGSNVLVIQTPTGTIEQPTLIFTMLKILKN